MFTFGQYKVRITDVSISRSGSKIRWLMYIVSTLGRLKEETVTSSSPVIAIREFQVIFSYGERILSQVPGQPLAME